MEYRRLGESGAVVSAYALGTMTGNYLDLHLTSRITRTRDFKTVLLPGDASMIGQYYTVELTGTTGSTFTGQIIRERAPLPTLVAS